MANAAILSPAVAALCRDTVRPAAGKTLLFAPRNAWSALLNLPCCGEIGRAEDRNRVHVRRFVAIVRRVPPGLPSEFIKRRRRDPERLRVESGTSVPNRQLQIWPFA